MGEEESEGAFGALVHQQQSKNDEDTNALGRDTLAGYISDSVKHTPLAVSNSIQY